VAQQFPTIAFEDIPMEEARPMIRGPRMEPMLCETLRQKIQALSGTAVCTTIPDGTSPSTLKNRILRGAAELNIPVTIRRVPGGLIFWRSTDEDIHQAHEVATRLQSARQPPQPTQRGRRSKGTR
jgi:hypothetical protein